MENILIIGLGNPGDKYASTRHNFGFMVIDYFADNQKLSWHNNKKWQSEIAESKIGDKKVIFAKPQTFMNASGSAVKKLVNFYKPAKIIVAYDDLNLNLGTIRLKYAGESGGHNGVKDIISNIGKNFWCFKLGIGPQKEKMAAEDFVLQKFANEEKEMVEKIVKAGSELLTDILNQSELEPKTINL